jgi:hypothetical protein
LVYVLRRNLQQITNLMELRIFQNFVEIESLLPYSQEPSQVFVLSQINPAQSDLLKINLNIITHLRLGRRNGIFLSGLPANNVCIVYTCLFSLIRTSCPANLILLNLNILILLCEEYKLQSSSFFSSLHLHITSPLFGRNILLAPCSQTLSLNDPPLMSETKFLRWKKGVIRIQFYLLAAGRYW